MERVAITGSSGYLGGRLVEHFRGRGARVLGVDLQAPGEVAPDEFVRGDICDASWLPRVCEFAPDTIIHGAFAFQPLHNAARMRQINVGGTQNMLRLVEQAGADRFMLISSATAFGAWPDNPLPIPEDWPCRARTGFQYAADKAEIEQLIEGFAREHATVHVSWVRPAIIGGPRMDNYLHRFIFGMPFLARLGGRDTPLQFVHEDDVVAAIDTILSANGRGGYNLGPPDWTPISELAGLNGRRAIRLPFWLAWITAWLAWHSRLGFHETPAGFLYFARYPWVVDPQRLTGELDYQFRYGSTETVRAILGDSGGAGD